MRHLFEHQTKCALPMYEVLLASLCNYFLSIPYCQWDNGFKVLSSADGQTLIIAINDGLIESSFKRTCNAYKISKQLQTSKE